MLLRGFIQTPLPRDPKSRKGHSAEMNTSFLLNSTPKTLNHRKNREVRLVRSPG